LLATANVLDVTINGKISHVGLYLPRLPYLTRCLTTTNRSRVRIRVTENFCQRFAGVVDPINFPRIKFDHNEKCGCCFSCRVRACRRSQNFWRHWAPPLETKGRRCLLETYIIPTCVNHTVFWSYGVTVSARTAAVLLPSLARRPGTLSRIISGIRTLLRTTSSAC